MGLRLHYLHSHLDYFQDKLGGCSKKVKTITKSLKEKQKYVSDAVV